MENQFVTRKWKHLLIDEKIKEEVKKRPCYTIEILCYDLVVMR